MSDRIIKDVFRICMGMYPRELEDQIRRIINEEALYDYHLKDFKAMEYPDDEKKTMIFLHFSRDC